METVDTALLRANKAAKADKCRVDMGNGDSLSRLQNLLYWFLAVAYRRWVERDVQVCHQRLSSAFDLLLIFVL